MLTKISANSGVVCRSTSLTDALKGSDDATHGVTHQCMQRPLSLLRGTNQHLHPRILTLTRNFVTLFPLRINSLYYTTIRSLFLSRLQRHYLFSVQKTKTNEKVKVKYQYRRFLLREWVILLTHRMLTYQTGNLPRHIKATNCIESLPIA
jgi:hypothetical protein